MGLLDDAIREHLEFKRQQGADPDEVARQEHEALGPVDRGDNGTPAEHADVLGDPALAQQEERPALPPVGARVSVESDPAHAGQETAELDMRTVLKAEGSVPAVDAAGDSLEWEVPGDAGSDSSVQRESGDPAGSPDSADEPVEDVLEETPDFLRDTPDQERMWFEQQPPRDFDFDK